MRIFTRTRSSVYGVAYTLFLLAATMFPFRFHFTAAYFHHRVPTINWFPIDPYTGDLDSRRTYADYVANIALFVPFGFLGFKALWGSPKGRILVMLAVGCIFSSGIEFTQLFTETRYTALSDMIFDTTGTTLGALLAAHLDRMFSEARSV